MKRNVSGLTLKCGFWGNMGPCFCNFPVTVYPMGRRACEGQIWKKQVAAFSRWGFLIFAGPSDHIASLRHQAQCRQRPERLAPGARRRRFGGQPPPQAAALGPEMAVPLFYIAEKAMMKEGTRFRRKICGLLPWALLLSLEDVRQLAGRYSSFVGRCPAACRGVIFFRGQFLYLRQLAGGLFFFRRRKKNQERRHPFERVDDDLGALPPRPPPPINGRPSHHRLLPALPCRPGETFSLPAARLRFVPAGRWPDQFHFAAVAKRIPPARRVGRVEAGGAI